MMDYRDIALELYESLTEALGYLIEFDDSEDGRRAIPIALAQSYYAYYLRELGEDIEPTMFELAFVEHGDE